MNTTFTQTTAIRRIYGHNVVIFIDADTDRNYIESLTNEQYIAQGAK